MYLKGCEGSRMEGRLQAFKYREQVEGSGGGLLSPGSEGCLPRLMTIRRQRLALSGRPQGGVAEGWRLGHTVDLIAVP